jgi:peroxiredoxin
MLRRLPGPRPAAVMRGKFPLIICALLLVLTLSLAACASSAAKTPQDADTRAQDASLAAAAPPDPTPASDGDSTLDFTAVDVVTGQSVSLSQFRGSTVLLNFVNYGCSSSLNKIVSDQLLTIRTLREQRGDFTPVSVFCGCCPPDVLRDFAEQNAMTWPWILDTDNAIVSQYYEFISQYGYPTLVLINGDLRVIEAAGYTDLDTLNTMLLGLGNY